MKVLLPLIIIFFATLTGCQKDDALQQVLRIKDMAELGTVEYTVSKIVWASDDSSSWKFGERKILFSTEARIKAGVDLSQIKSQDVEIIDKGVKLRLPRAKIIYLTMEPDKIQEQFSEIGLFRHKYSNEEKLKILTLGEQSIYDAIPDLGILDVAEKNTEKLLRSWLKQINFNSIEISYAD